MRHTTNRVRAILLLTLVAAMVGFAVVQDRVVASGARRYVALQRQAMAGLRVAVTIDEVMAPAVARSTRQGLLCAGGILFGGLGVAMLASRRAGRDRGGEL